MGATVVARGELNRARLAVELRQDGELSYLAVNSKLDPRQSFLLPVSTEQACAGLCLPTRMGRFGALCWGLAYGSGTPTAGWRVRFESGTLRHARTVEVAPQRLTGQCWVADGEGFFARAILTDDDRVEIARAQLANGW